jgi:enoyl-CoA hydratase/carnithine racemase
MARVSTFVVDHVATIGFPDYADPAGPAIDFRADLESLCGDPEVRCIVLDLTPVAPTLDGHALQSISLFTLPIVCAFTSSLHGPALALALDADIRVCGSSAGIQGPVDGEAAEARLRTLCPNPASLAILESGGLLTAEAALVAGLVSAVTPPGQALIEATRIAHIIASRGPIATQLGKEAVWRGLALPFEAALRFETDLTLLLQTTKDRAEGVIAFLQKRQPEFTGE